MSENAVADPAHDWGYTSRGNADNPKIPTPRGKVLGGSSAVNAGVAIGARAADLAKWASYGADGWSYDEALPIFKQMENTPMGDDAYHLRAPGHRGSSRHPRGRCRGGQPGPVRTDFHHSGR
jgi:choline dehydrogenase